MRTLGDKDIARICDTFLNFKESKQNKVFDNAIFGYRKVTTERPLRIKQTDPNHLYKAAEIKIIKDCGTWSEGASPIIRRIHKCGTEPNSLCDLFGTTVHGMPAVVEYEPDTDLRDTEQIPLQEESGIEAFLRREVLPYIVPDSVKIGYEIIGVEGR